jgi:hypothetical protein
VQRIARRVTTLTLYSRPGCHLCDEMKATIVEAAASIPLTLEQVDISSDPELERRYGLEIPVLLIDGRKVAKFRVGRADLLRMLRARQPEADGAGGG